MSDFFAIDGVVMPAAEARISVLDLGFLRGTGAFETFRTYAGGHPHALAEHLRRLWVAAEACGIAPCFRENDLRKTVAEIRERSGHDEMRVNLVVSPGVHTEGVFGSAAPTWVVIARDLHAPPESAYRDGVSAVTFLGARLLPDLKTTSYLSGRPGILQAGRAGAHEAFYMDAQGFVSEGVTSNVLIVKDGAVRTPQLGCLAGISRGGVEPVCRHLGLRWEFAPLHRDDLYSADEVWITSAVREVLPIVRVDDQSIADGKPGRWAGPVRAAYRASAEDEARRDAFRSDPTGAIA